MTPKVNTITQPAAPSRPVTRLERMKIVRQGKEAEFAKLYQELIELDDAIARYERLSNIDPRLESLLDAAWKVTG